MSSVLSIAVTGMAAAQARLEVSARNVANAGTSGPFKDRELFANASDEVVAAFRALSIDQIEVTGGGTATKVRQTPAGTEVDIVQEAVQQVIAGYTFAANAKVAKAAADMQKTLLDVLR